MSTLQDIESEVQQAADNMTVEVLLMLIDKWERDIDVKRAFGKATVKDALDHYVRLKITLHHIVNHIDRDGWTHAFSRVDDAIEYIRELDHKILKARRDYYVARRRYEGEHSRGCSCRGCKCLVAIPGARANEACSSAN